MTVARSLALVLLAGCYDFVGDLGNIGFSSDLRTGAGAWTPDAPVAAGTTATLVARERLDREQEESPRVYGRARGLDDWWAQDGSLTLVAPERGSAVLTWQGEVQDRFRVRFAQAESIEVSDEVLTWAGQAHDLETLAFVRGATARFSPRVLDRRGAELGWRQEDLAFRADGAVSAWSESGELSVAADGPGEIVLALLGEDLSTLPVVVVEPAEIAEVELLPLLVDADADQAAVLALCRLADGTPVWGAPVTWTWEGRGEVPEERPDALVVTGERATVRAEVAGIVVEDTFDIASLPKLPSPR